RPDARGRATAAAGGGVCSGTASPAPAEPDAGAPSRLQAGPRRPVDPLQRPDLALPGDRRRRNAGAGGRAPLARWWDAARPEQPPGHSPPYHNRLRRRDSSPAGRTDRAALRCAHPGGGGRLQRRGADPPDRGPDARRRPLRTRGSRARRTPDAPAGASRRRVSYATRSAEAGATTAEASALRSMDRPWKRLTVPP